jgi:hypothetical protein
MVALPLASASDAVVTRVTGSNYTWVWVVALVSLLALGVAAPT